MNDTYVNTVKNFLYDSRKMPPIYTIDPQGEYKEFWNGVNLDLHDLSDLADISKALMKSLVTIDYTREMLSKKKDWNEETMDRNDHLYLEYLNWRYSGLPAVWITVKGATTKVDHKHIDFIDSVPTDTLIKIGDDFVHWDMENPFYISILRDPVQLFPQSFEKSIRMRIGHIPLTLRGNMKYNSVVYPNDPNYIYDQGKRKHVSEIFTPSRSKAFLRQDSIVNLSNVSLE